MKKDVTKAERLPVAMAARRFTVPIVLFAGLAFWAFLALADRGDWWRKGGPIDQWQTLIGGGFAIFAALLGGAFVLAQIHVAKMQEAERLERRHAAARALAPMALSGLMEYARGCGRALRRVYLATRAEAVREAEMQGFELPAVPTASIDLLVQLIEAAPSEIGEAIADLLAELQVQDGRLRSTKADVLDPQNAMRSVMKIALDDFIIDAASIYARCEGMLDYSRRESTLVSGQPKVVDLLRALTLMGFHEAAFARVKATVARRHGDVVAAIETG